MSQNNSAEAQAQRETEARVSSQTIYEGRKLSLKVDTITLADGQSYKREIVVHPGAVVMVALDDDGNIYLVKQWRRAAGRVLLELPAGTLEKDEAPDITASRELQEEIGLKAGQIEPLGGFFSAPGFSTEYLHLYVARDLTESQLPADEHEEIEVLKVSLEEAMRLIEAGEIQDAKSVAGLCRYYIRNMGQP